MDIDRGLHPKNPRDSANFKFGTGFLLQLHDIILISKSSNYLFNQIIASAMMVLRKSELKGYLSIDIRPL